MVNQQTRVVFLDDGGVLNDNRLRRGEWQRLVGVYLSEQLGGDAIRWGETNAQIFPDFWSDYSAQLSAFETHRGSQRAYDLGWMTVMCSAMGRARLPDDEAIRIARGCAIFVGGRADAEIEGAAAGVARLYHAGFTLHMASGTTSWELEAILSKMGIRPYINALIGPDVIDVPKSGARFYAAIQEQTGVDVSRSLVIESSRRACRWAEEAGFSTIRCDIEEEGSPTLAAVAERLATPR